MHLRPEVTVIICACSLPGKAEGLARVSSANNVNWPNVFPFQSSHVLKDRYIRPVLLQQLLAVRLNLAERHGFNLTRPVSRQREAADTAEKVEHLEFHRAALIAAFHSATGISRHWARSISRAWLLPRRLRISLIRVAWLIG
jgi:hypothetical protein